MWRRQCGLPVRRRSDDWGRRFIQRWHNHASRLRGRRAFYHWSTNAGDITTGVRKRWRPVSESVDDVDDRCPKALTTGVRKCWRRWRPMSKSVDDRCPKVLTTGVRKCWRRWRPMSESVDDRCPKVLTTLTTDVRKRWRPVSESVDGVG